MLVSIVGNQTDFGMIGLERISRKLMHLKLHPIRVFLFHQVSDIYDEALCKVCDWTCTDVFKSMILKLKENYEFMSLSQAVGHLQKDMLRTKKYAVLTNDDGASCLKQILPWLKEQGVPVTLFVNAKYLDGVSYRNKPTEKYLTKDELFALDYEGIEVANHGWEHNDITKLDWRQFVDSVERNVAVLRGHPCYVPFWAYTWGRYTQAHDDYLISRRIVPVLIDGMKNYNDATHIHRELLDGKSAETLC